jgi:hypothetical protein
VIEMQYGIIEPPSVLQDFTLILTVILSFVLIVLAIWLSLQNQMIPAIFSLIGAGFLIWIIGAMKGAFR